MEISIRNYRVIKSADLVVDPGAVALVCGRNGQGKTSIAEAVRAALTGNPLAASDDAEGKRTKGRAGEMVREGEKSATVEIKGPDGRSKISWPSGEAVGSGVPIRASHMACGFRDASLVSLNQKERFAALREALKADVEFNDLRAWLTMKRAEPPPVIQVIQEDLARQVWKTILDSDWPSAQQHAKERGIILQNRYKDATGEEWGSLKADGWRPADWEAKFEGRPYAEFVGAAKLAEARYLAAIGDAAVDGDRRARLATLADALPTALSFLSGVEAGIADLQQEEADHIRVCSEFVNPDAGPVLLCPHCSKEVAVVKVPGGNWSTPDMSLQKPVVLDEKARKAARLRRAQLDGIGGNIKGRLDAATTLRQDTKKTVLDGERARDELAAMGPPGNTSDEGVIAQSKTALEEARRNLAMVDAVAGAEKLHQQILVNRHLQAALGDAGVRAFALQVKIRDFNDRLASLSGICGIGTTVIDPETANISVDGRPFRDLSGAEGLRLKVLLQVAIAGYDGSDMVVIDVKDATDRKHVLALVKMLNAAEMTALVVCHMNAMEDAPDLGSVKAVELGYRGKSYWIEGGISAPVEQSGDK